VHTGYEQKATGDDRRAHGAGKDQAMWKRTKNPAVRRLVKRWRDAASASISLIVAEPRGGAVA